MTLLGLDFDNTLVRYDKLFYQLALDKGLIEEGFTADKTEIRDYLRSQGKDDQFTLMQGEVYGLRILEAEPAEGMLKALDNVRSQGVRMVLISHKTKHPYKGPAYDLHNAALDWLKKHSFFDRNGLAWSKDQIVFAESKQKKIETISKLRCTYYIDDLEEILKMLPSDVKKILYTQEKPVEVRKDEITAMVRWSELTKMIDF